MFRTFLIILLQTSVIYANFNSSQSVKGESVLSNSVKETYTDLKSLVCSSFPATCSRVETFRKFLNFGAFEGRGPKDLIAIVSTMLATLLGAILVKLNVLIVLSLISVGIGKLLVMILTLKSHIFSQKQQPIVYEKIYYPKHHHDYINQLPQSYQEDYPSYTISS